jgi:hypothetical protein
MLKYAEIIQPCFLQHIGKRHAQYSHAVFYAARYIYGRCVVEVPGRAGDLGNIKAGVIQSRQNWYCNSRFSTHFPKKPYTRYGIPIIFGSSSNSEQV